MAGPSSAVVQVDYSHSLLHAAIVRKDYAALRRILAALPKPTAASVKTEEESIAMEKRAEDASLVLDKRDVIGGETPLHLAVRLVDPQAVELLMAAGADVSLQNEAGWTALQEAVCNGEQGIATIIMRHYQVQAWAKWCRRLPRLSATMKRMRDFYMEVTWNFESSVIPFIGRIAPSDTYRIWKRGAALRADMTLAGFDGLRIQRSEQTFLFLGEGSKDGRLPPGTVCMLAHKEKEAVDALEGVGSQPNEAELAQDVAAMFQTNVYRAGIDVTEAVLSPQTNWRRQERVESVGSWKAKVYDMLHVQVSFRSRRVPGALSDEELFAGDADDAALANGNDYDEDNFSEILTEDERKQLEAVLRSDENEECGVRDGGGEPSCASGSGTCCGETSSNSSSLQNSMMTNGDVQEEDVGKDKEKEREKESKKAWFSWGKKEKNGKGGGGGSGGGAGSKGATPTGKSPARWKRHAEDEYRLIDDGEESNGETNSVNGGAASDGSIHRTSNGALDSHSESRKGGSRPSSSSPESEYVKGLKPTLWLTDDFPLTVQELLPLLDLMSPRVKAVRRLRELLTTKLPTGSFPVKVAIPIVPTIRVVVTFAKFVDESVIKARLEGKSGLSTPIGKAKKAAAEISTPAASSSSSGSSSSWLSWLRTATSSSHSSGSPTANGKAEDADQGIHLDEDVFKIPTEYKWIDLPERRRRQEKRKKASKKSKDKKESGKERWE
ncbi:hypothetical protein CBR_g48701 [Chara braunii]|uniref:Ankyrin repeat domain-containing protein n=1 Tax=Chara braunii TaxID=69332 RepID=A0A388K4G6_CHABU|nr:hypothetical protein CBR_g48701 [Chara braunii]|eukprot:GBG64952.1 hypothetical protein CBR_g48701 [Chara braunii]